MASSGKFDLSSSSPRRRLYTSGDGSRTAASMQRSASFRDNMENPILSSLPSMSKSTINVSQGDVTKFLQCLRFDLKSMAAEYKCNQYGDDVWSNRGKKRELQLDDVAAAAGMTCTSSGLSSGVGRAIVNSVKGKRSERDPRNVVPKIGRPAKIKAKLEQKTTQLSASVNGSLGNFSDQQRATSSFVPKPTANEKDECMLLENFEEDIGSWLNIDDDILQHHDDDFMGFEIPMDDLTDLNMMV